MRLWYKWEVECVLVIHTTTMKPHCAQRKNRIRGFKRTVSCLSYQFLQEGVSAIA